MTRKHIDFKEMYIENLLPADYNPRQDLQPGDPDYDALKKSIEEFGFVQNVVWNKQTERVVGGHQRIKVLKDLGYKRVMVSIVDIDENLEKALNVGLNNIEGSWDMTKLQSLLSELVSTDIDLDLTGFTDDEMESILQWDSPDFDDVPDDDGEEKYTSKVDIPQYQMTGEKPEIEELTNIEKPQELLAKIESSDLSEDEKEFLRRASTRHINFNYKKIAEFYAHASKEMQTLMEQSALVIIDYEDAIKQGFIRLTSKLEEIRNDELQNEEVEELEE
jgi:uncharacterized Fe-S cluster-containing radical SAM superfamily enzyme